MPQTALLANCCRDGTPRDALLQFGLHGQGCNSAFPSRNIDDQGSILLLPLAGRSCDDSHVANATFKFLPLTKSNFKPQNYAFAPAEGLKVDTQSLRSHPATCCTVWSADVLRNNPKAVGNMAPITRVICNLPTAIVNVTQVSRWPPQSPESSFHRPQIFSTIDGKTVKTRHFECLCFHIFFAVARHPCTCRGPGLDTCFVFGTGEITSSAEAPQPSGLSGGSGEEIHG